MDYQKITTYLIKIVGKTYYQESRGELFKADVKKQDTYCLRCKLISQKAICADCGAKKVGFCKEIKA